MGSADKDIDTDTDKDKDIGSDLVTFADKLRNLNLTSRVSD